MAHKHEPTWADSHAKRVIARLEQHVFPWLGSRPINEIKAPELLAALRRVESKGALESAHRMRTISGQVFRYAIATGRCERDISQDRGTTTSKSPAIPAHSRCCVRLNWHQWYFRDPVRFVKCNGLTLIWKLVNGASSPAISEPAKSLSFIRYHSQNRQVDIFRDLRPLTGHGQYVFPSPRTKDRKVEMASQSR